MDDKFRSRKFALTLLAFSMACLFLAFGLIGSGEWLATITLALGMYQAANVWQREVEK